MITTEWEQYISAGTTAYERGDYREAIKQFEDALNEAEKFGEKDPRYATSLNNLAVLYNTQHRQMAHLGQKDYRDWRRLSFMPAVVHC